MLARLKYYFRFDGRLPRSRYWIMTIRCIMAFWVLIMICIALAPNFRILALALAISTYIATCIVTWSLMARRLHDIGLSALWLILIFATQIIAQLLLDDEFYQSSLMAISFALFSTVSFLVLALLKGNNGSNKFGPDPLD